MKELVVIIGTVVLGCIIFNLIAGDSSSLKSAGSDLMKETIKIYEEDRQ